MILTKLDISSVNLENKVRELIKSGKLEEVLFIVPTNRKLRAFKKEVIDLSPQDAVSDINIETLTTISEKLLLQSERFIPLSEAASTILIKQAAESVKLNYLVNYKDEIPFGTLDRIKNVISEYKRHGIYPDDLRREAEKLDLNEKAKALDIANIYEVYLQKCLDLDALEIGDVYFRLNSLATEKFDEIFLNVYPRLKYIIMNGFDEFTSLEVYIINKLANQSTVEMYLNFDYYRNNPLIFSHLDRSYELLKDKGFAFVEDKSRIKPDEFQDSIRKNLFIKSFREKNNAFEGTITKLTGRTVEEEIQLIAKEIKELILINKVEPHKICAVFNLVNNYSSLVRDIFDTNGIPVNLTDRTLLDNSPPVIALINFLEIAENDFYYKNIFRALSNKYLSKFDIDIANLNIIAAELKIIAGFENWTNSIKEKIRELELEMTGEEEYQPVNIENYQQGLNDLTLLKESLEPFTKKQTVKEFFFSLQKFISSSGIGISVLGDGENSEKNIKGLTTFLEVTEEIFNLLKLEYDEDKQFGLSFYLDQLKTASSWARFNTKERSDLGVTVTSVNEIRGLTFDYLFIGGMNDGVFPTRFNPEIFFSGSFAKQDNVHQTEERYHFYQTLCSWDKRLYLSYSLMEEGKELVESSFMKDFENLFSLSHKTYLDYHNCAYNREDVLIRIGEKVSCEGVLESLTAKEDFEEICRKINIEKMRIETPFYESGYNGYIGTEENIEALKNIASREFSITQLETYAKCPFKYFATYILKLSEIGEPTEELEAVEIGSLLHRILYQFYTRLNETGIKLRNCGNAEFKTAEKLIFQTAEENLSAAIFNSELTFFEKERILGIDGDKKQSILFKFLEAERNDQSEFLPKFFEVNFGSVKGRERDEYLSHDEPVEYEGIKLRGKIDRIDISEDERINVVDYKLSGKKPTINEINEGISLQLPVYFYAAKQLFGENSISVKPNEMYIYSLKYNYNQFGKTSVSLTRKKNIDPAELAEEVMTVSMEKIKEYVQAMEKGHFPLTKLEDREKKVCGYCNFKEICRIEETEL